MTTVKKRRSAGLLAAAVLVGAAGLGVVAPAAHASVEGAVSLKGGAPLSSVEHRPGAKQDSTRHEIHRADARDGLRIDVHGEGYDELPEQAGDYYTGLFFAILDRDVPSAEAEERGVGRNFLSRWGSNYPETGVLDYFVTAPASSLDANTEYDVLVWVAEGAPTSETVLYRAPIELSDEHREGLFPEETPEPTPTETPDPTPTATEDPEPTPTDSPDPTPTDRPTADPTDDPTDDPTEDAPAEPELAISPERILAEDFADEDGGVTLTVDGLDEGTDVSFEIEPLSGQSVESGALGAVADEEGRAAAVVYGTDASRAEAYLGEFSVGADLDDDGEADLRGSFEVVSEEGAPGEDDGDRDRDDDDRGGSDDGDGGRDLPRTGSGLTALFAGIGAIALGATALFFARRRA